MAINKEALAALIVAQTGNAEFTVDMLDDSMLNGLIIEEEVLEDQEDEETSDDADTEEEDENEEDEENDPLADLDPTQLSPTERMFYEYVVSEKEKAKKREISLLISGSQLDVQHKLILDRMAKDGVPIKSIEATIADFKQIQASSTRVGGMTKIVSKSKVKGGATTKQKTPKPGTKEFGQYLANLKKNKKI
ncbi:MAG: hypothetical protein ACRCX7_11585 [Cetobacterium sp.]|uniref:hypothetical protein n=1 Tax=Cetobacterium sp. TaxID=2071632 RepID=UPI003F3C8080